MILIGNYNFQTETSRWKVEKATELDKTKKKIGLYFLIRVMLSLVPA